MHGRRSRRGWGRAFGVWVIFAAALFVTTCNLSAQEKAAESNQPRDSEAVPKSQLTETRELDKQTSQTRKDESGNALEVEMVRNLWRDQKTIWTSPSRLRWDDATWLLPLVEATGGFFATDRAVPPALSNSPSRLNRYRDLSNDGLAALLAGTGGVYVWSFVTRDRQQRETGVLATQAVLESVAINSVWEYSLGREEPYQDAGRGRFFAGGTSFPSDHAAAAWSAASVIAHEYPGPLTEFIAYGTATAVTASRVLGKEHFPSDVVVGSAMGWLIGHEVYRLHHDPDLGGGGWRSLSGDEGERSDTRNVGSPFIPLDSWVYPALERLAALGMVKTSMAGLRPWTRIGCARLIQEATDRIADDGNPGAGESELVSRLEQEFSYEIGLLAGNRNLTANVGSIYARGVSISGPPLTNFHFGQTLAYDFGRPFERGMNAQAGGSWSAAAGPVVLYIRAEYQHAPSAPALSDAARFIIGLRDVIPEPPATPLAAIDRPRLLDSYLAVNVHNFEISLGKQSMDWGPGPGGSLLLSDNAEPVNMARIVNPEPFRLPGFLQYLGPVRMDQFFGRLQGHTYTPRPFIYGQKINFKPCPWLELGFGRTTMLGGTGGDPVTAGNLFRSFFPPGLNPHTRAVPGDGRDVMDWTFYIPGVRNYVVFYGEVYADDDVIAWQDPPKNPYRPGIYVTRIPGVSKMDFHAEFVSTESPGWVTPNGNHGNLNYWNSTYRDGYTNNGNLMGNTVGRMGRAVQCWSTYRFDARTSLQFIYKHNSVSPDFIPQGGFWQDYTLQNEMYLRSGFYLKGEMQYEHISSFPILFTGSRENVSAILELGFYPSHERKAESR